MEAQRSRWKLVRIAGDDQINRNQSVYSLKAGLNVIGRNPKADVITDSVLASRSHCTIELNTKKNILTVIDSVCIASTRMNEFTIITFFILSVVKRHFRK